MGDPYLRGLEGKKEDRGVVREVGREASDYCFSETKGKWRIWSNRKKGRGRNPAPWMSNIVSCFQEVKEDKDLERAIEFGKVSHSWHLRGEFW